MSGRPKNITPISGNYSSGPYSGTAKRVPGAGYYTPDTLVAAQDVNDELGKLQDTQQALINGGGGQGAAMNWPALSTDVTVGGSNPTFNNLAWDSKYGRWLIVGKKTGTTNANLAYASKNGGRTWFSFGGANPSSGPCDGSIVGAIFNPATGKVAVCTYAGTAADPAALTDEEARLNVGTNQASVTGIAFNGLYIFIGANNSTTPLLQTCPLGSNTWTNHAPTFAAPTSWCGAGLGGGFSGYAVASNGSVVMCVALGVTNYGEYVLSDSAGTTWTVHTHTFASGWANTGLAWAGDRWVLSQSNGTNSQVLTSTDGVTWFSGTTLLNVFLGGVSAIGSLLFAAAYTHLDIRGAWSTDSGNTWQYGGQYDITLWNAGNPDRSFSNGSQFATLSGIRAAFSNFMATPGTQGF